ncbi:phage tail sheath family protein [Dinoroseobacter sp. S375]|uniref:phage tail sheath family protein n=1 Tax=Dinoroseobacter sp. S375 TaxID=3415136 RepID=UPI003C7C3C5F
MAQYKTPGVYITERNAFPSAVVEVPMAVPAFLGYTAQASRGSEDVTGVPERIASYAEYLEVFGEAPARRFAMSRTEDGDVFFTPVGQRFYLDLAMRMFFDNGGNACWVISLGGFEAESYGAADASDAIWDALAKEPEPAAYVMPDAVALSRDDHRKITERMMQECQKLQDRMAILDIYDGRVPAGMSPAEFDWHAEAINGPTGFRAIDLGDKASFGAAYFPWLNSSLISEHEVSFAMLDADSRASLAAQITAELTPKTSPLPSDTEALLTLLTKSEISAEDCTRCHKNLSSVSKTYWSVMSALADEINIIPPSGAMAGVWSSTDMDIGVWKAPANTAVAGTVGPAITINDTEQEDLNVPLDGKAINAIRSFRGRGNVVWGARTLDGNSQDWRYVNVRRTMIMLEQSIANAAQACVFEPNTADTWGLVRTVIENFLTNQWKAGALAGATAEEAYRVSVGLGSTMTGNDILDGYMRIVVQVAITRPAEFIEIPFQLKMQTS